MADNTEVDNKAIEKLTKELYELVALAERDCANRAIIKKTDRDFSFKNRYFVKDVINIV